MDCLELLRTLPDNSVDLFLQDPPFNTTACKWEYDLIPLFPKLWEQWLRVGKENAAFIFMSAQPFTTDLINSNRKLFRYENIWNKGMGVNPQLANKMPMKSHENIVLFYRKLPTYNPQKRKGMPYKKKATEGKYVGNTFKIKERVNYDNPSGDRLPLSIVDFKHESSRFATQNGQNRHPTQKPIKLFEYLIKTYSNEDDIVFDGYLGSGTTALAAYNTNRNFIGSELDKTYFDSMKKLFDIHRSQLLITL